MPTELPRRRVTEVWTWLPAFRAVAEAQHVHRAAKELHVTASSLSRSIRLLEDHLGKRLFDRVGRNIRLNHEGEALLVAVRDSMRRVDDGISHVTGTVVSGELRIACEGDQPLGLAWRAASRLMARYPTLTTNIEEVVVKRDVAARLLRGDLDVAVVTSSPTNARLQVDRIAEVTYGIYCGPDHPLRNKRNASIDTIAKYPFVAPTSDEDGPVDQWPKERPRRVMLRLPALEAAVAACESGEWLAVLPDAAATTLLRRLPSDIVPATSLFAVHRAASGEVSKASLFVSELRAGAVTAQRGRPPRAAAPSRRAKP